MATFEKMVDDLRTTFNSGITRNLEWRKSQLRAICDMLSENESFFINALKEDLSKSTFEAYLFDVGPCMKEASTTIRNLNYWAAPQKVNTELMYKLDKAYITWEPYGVSLIIGCWNYPVQLVLQPLIGAIAAGNCCVIKPSEVAQNTARLLEELIPKYLDQRCYKVVTGGAAEATRLLMEKFDVIFYTGNSNVARDVMAAAARHLTPVVLELGGKSPAFVDSGMDLRVVSRRIAWGKWINCGQTCIAPDYVICTPEVQEKLIDQLKAAYIEFYTENPQMSGSYGRIVNNYHFRRIVRLLDGERISFGGEVDETDSYIAPTVVRDCKLDAAVMKQEVFGPVLPFVTVCDYNEAIEIINSRERPLALYVFTKRPHVISAFRNSTSSGSLMINDTVSHVAVHELPFGGVGNSGMGSYHGKFSFESFSHRRGCLEKRPGMEFFNFLRYPPYTPNKLWLLNRLTSQKMHTNGIIKSCFVVILGMALFLVLRYATMGK